MYRTETHLHTSEASGCAASSGAEQADRYKELGYDTIFVTDHFINANTAVDRSLPWSDWVDGYCRGYENAKKRGEEIGLTVLFGIEYGWNGTDLLTYGVDKAWLKENPDLPSISAQEYCKRVHAAGGFIVHAHPFRQEAYIPELKFLPDFTDAVEIFNGRNREAAYNERARWYADQFGFPYTAGSDCHAMYDNCFFGILTEFKINTVEQYIDAVKNRRISALYLNGQEQKLI